MVGGPCAILYSLDNCGIIYVVTCAASSFLLLVRAGGGISGASPGGTGRMEVYNMDSTTLSQVAGISLSLLFSYIPGLKDRYAALDSTAKQGVMALVVVLVASGVFVGSCYDLLGSVTCDKAGAVGLFGVVLQALIANQTMYLFSPKAAGSNGNK